MIAVARRAVLLSGLLLVAASARAETPYITVASTTSTEQSGLFGHLLPAFTKSSGIEVRVVAVGTGQALKIGERGDGDVLFVHDKPSEEKFVADGFGIERRDGDVQRLRDGRAERRSGQGRWRPRRRRRLAQDRRGQGALRLARRRQRHRQGGEAAVAGGRHRHQSGVGHLVSRHRLGHGADAQHRGGDGRLHARRPRHLAQLPEPPRRSRSWSRATGSLFNQYGVMLVNPARQASVKQELGRRFIDWLVSPEGQARSPPTRSTASSSSSPTPRPRADRRTPALRRGVRRGPLSFSLPP